jgi:cell wall-associated NlpC family hydrolase
VRRFRTIALAALLCATCAAALAAVAADAAPGPQARAAAAARAQAGVPYLWGGDSPRTGFDSSGLVVWAYGRVGIALPHAAPVLWDAGRHVTRAQLRPGDLVFFDHAGHVGIYLGHGEFVHATHTGAPVAVQRLRGFLTQYSGAVRIARPR